MLVSADEMYDRWGRWCHPPPRVTVPPSPSLPVRESVGADRVTVSTGEIYKRERERERGGSEREGGEQRERVGGGLL